MKFNLHTILRTAHAAAKHRMAPSHAFRYGDRWNSEVGGYVPLMTYREVFRAQLRWAWRDAKVAAENAAIDAETRVTDEVRLRAREIRIAAQFQPINSAGNRRMRELMDQADALLEAA